MTASQVSQRGIDVQNVVKLLEDLYPFIRLLSRRLFSRAWVVQE